MQKFTFPYLLLAPDYRESSLGIQVMHRLCHMINEQGGKAWMVNCAVNPLWNTPCLGEQEWNEIQNSGQPWIAVYPEVVSGNPLSAPICVRYMLNREGVITNNSLQAGADDLFFWYRSEFAEKLVNPEILCLEAYDLDMFCDDNPQKDLHVLYLNRVPKSVVDFSQLPTDIHILSMEDPLTHAELAQLLKRTKVLYSFESSGTCTLAILCGSPVVALTAKGYEHHAINAITIRDNDGAGITLENTPEGIASARQTIGKMWGNMIARRAVAQRQFERFVELTQEHGAKRSQKDREGSLTQWLQTRSVPEKLWPATQNGTARLLIVVQENAEGDLQQTFKTLRTQLNYASACHVLVVSSDSHNEDSGFRIHYCTPDLLISMVNLLAQQHAFDWIQFIPAGSSFSAEGIKLAVNALQSIDNLAMVYADEAIDVNGVLSPHFKPDFNLDLFLSAPHLYLQRGFFHREALLAIGGLDPDTGCCFELDAILKILTRFDIGAIGHFTDIITLIPREIVIPTDREQQQRVLHRYLMSRGFVQGNVTGQPGKPWRMEYTHCPLSFSVILLAGDNLLSLQRCFSTLYQQTQGQTFETRVVLQPQTPDEIRHWLNWLVNNNTAIIHLTETVEKSAVLAVNMATQQAGGEYLLLLNASIAFVSSNWFQALANHAHRPEVGCVAPQQINFDNQIVSAGYLLGINGLAFPMGYGEVWGSAGYLSRLQSDCDYSALSTDCLLIRNSLWQQIGGFDTQFTQPLLAEIDLGLRIRETGHLSVCTAYGVVARDHTISGYPSYCLPQPSPELDFFYRRWLINIAQDPVYNVRYSLSKRLFQPDALMSAGWNPLHHHGIPNVILIVNGQQDVSIQRFILILEMLASEHVLHLLLLESVLTAPELFRLKPDVLLLAGNVNNELCLCVKQFKQHNTCQISYLLSDDIQKFDLKNLFELELIDTWLTSSTAYANWLKKRHKIAVILPNIFPEQCHHKESQPHNAKPRALCITRYLSDKDRQLLDAAIETSSELLEWVIVGDTPKAWLPYIAETHRYLDEHRLTEQLASLSINFAVIPRSSNDENRFKDNLCLMPLAACAIPALCSDVPSLASSLPGWRVKNNTDAWKKAIHMRCEAPDETERLSSQLHSSLSMLGNKEQRVACWLKALGLKSKE